MHIGSTEIPAGSALRQSSGLSDVAHWSDYAFCSSSRIFSRIERIFDQLGHRFGWCSFNVNRKRITEQFKSEFLDIKVSKSLGKLSAEFSESDVLLLLFL